jgi:oxygen-independent coproporphyrinogen-3 oxidase
MPPFGPHYGFGLYVHWPYCARICPYCDFNVYAAKERETGPLVEAILQDIQAHKARLHDHPPLTSIFLGGGTPSLLSAHDLEAIIQTATDQFGLEPNGEVTLEANPNDVLRSDPSDWQKAGINRVSLGLQSLDDAALTFLGRDHDSTNALRAVEAVQAVFDNHSLDLIYARPGQTISDWQGELSQVLALGAPHLSLYELTIEERTAFGKRAARGELIPMQDDDQADLYELTQTLCEAAGLPAYEVSNHAHSPEYESRHNHIYWANGDWIGVGPGAHGRLTIDETRYATEAARRPADYIAAPSPTNTALPTLDAAREMLAMGLRPATGLDLTRLSELGYEQPDQTLLTDLKENGIITQAGQSIALTAQGRLLADAVAKQLAASMDL